MKLHRILIVVLAVFLLSNCSSDSPVTIDEVILECEFSLELSFGDADTLDAYLLAKPSGIIVTGTGDIIVVDENRLKVYDGSGIPKRIIGRPGPGPGEFGRYITPAITETGYLTVKNDFDNYNLYAPDYTFIESKSLIRTDFIRKMREEHNLTGLRITSIYAYSPEEIIMSANAMMVDDDLSYWVIIHQKSGNTNLVAHYEDKSVVDSNPRWSPMIEYGELQMAFLPGRKIVYANTGEDKTFENEMWYYHIYIYDLETGEQSEIKREYIPMTLPDSVIYKKTSMYRGPLRGEDFLKMQSNKYKEIGVYGTFRELMTDGNYIFAIKFETYKDKGLVTDILDASSGEYLHTVYFPFIPDVIHDWYAYRIKQGPTIFPVVEKYKLDPAVYGK